MIISWLIMTFRYRRTRGFDHPIIWPTCQYDLCVLILHPTNTPDVSTVDFDMGRLINLFHRVVFCVCHTMTQTIAAMGNEFCPTFKAFWKGYNIWNLISNIGDSWIEIKQSTVMEKTLPTICNRLSRCFKRYSADHRRSSWFGEAA